MGWVGYFEDNWDRLQASIANAEALMASALTPAEDKLRAGRHALGDAKQMLEEIFKHLDLATSPELDLAHKNQEQLIVIFKAKTDLDAAVWKLEASEKERCAMAAELEDLRRRLVEMEAAQASMRSKLAKLESPEHWHAEVARYLSMPEIRKNRRDKRG